MGLDELVGGIRGFVVLVLFCIIVIEIVVRVFLDVRLSWLIMC